MALGTAVAAMQQSSHHACRAGCRKTQALPRTRSNTSKGSSPGLPKSAASQPAAPPAAETTDAPPTNDPTVIHRIAQDRAVAAGGTLVPEEVAKRTKNPFDMWDEMAANVAAGRFPKGTNVFLHKFH